jgi:hypothetical protein
MVSKIPGLDLAFSGFVNRILKSLAAFPFCVQDGKAARFSRK